MRIIGITGPTGAGKSLLCRYFEKQNIPCIDADRVYHEMLIPPSECLDEIRRVFGDGIFSPNGQLDRAKLGAIVFSSPEKLDLLNRTVLQKVLAHIRLLISDFGKDGYDTVAVDAPTLIESGFDKECSLIISVLASANTRKTRITERDSLTEEQARLRINAQKSDDFYRAHSNIVIENDGDRKRFEAKISELLAKLFA